MDHKKQPTHKPIKSASKPLILITNDDGIYAPGIKHLWQVLNQFADCYVVAPSLEQSAVSLSITIRQPLLIEKVEWVGLHAKTWSVNGTPADCVKLALHSILPERPTLVVSGINRGSNAGRNVLYSGTVAGAIEGVMHDIPGIAFSALDLVSPSCSAVAQPITTIIDYVLAHSLPQGTLLNVNFPKDTEKGIKGLRLAKQGCQYWQENIERRYHPAEHTSYYWLGAQLAAYEEEKDSDVSYLEEGYATVVPIKIIDLTNQSYLKNHAHAFTNISK